MLNGSCLCGAVGYAIDGLDMPILHCHCLTCQKAHAAAFATTAGVLREHFHWVRGEDRLSCHESSPGKLRHLCSVCGSQLIAERPGQPHVILRVATLDRDPRRATCPAHLDLTRPSLAEHGWRHASLSRVAAWTLNRESAVADLPGQR